MALTHLDFVVAFVKHLEFSTTYLKIFNFLFIIVSFRLKIDKGQVIGFFCCWFGTLGSFFYMSLFQRYIWKWYFWINCFCGQRYSKELAMEKMNQINWKVKHFPVVSLHYKICWKLTDDFSLLLLVLCCLAYITV